MRRGRELHFDIESGIFNDILTPGYVPMFEGYPMTRIHDGYYPSRLSAVTDKNAKRVAKDRARNKAARKQRQQRRK